MALISKNDLEYRDDYSWESKSENSSLLNRNEGYEVLNFINAFCEKFALKEKESVIMIENAIRFVVPGNIQEPDKIEKYILDFAQSVKLVLR